MFPDRAKWAAQGRRRRKSVHRSRANLAPISVSVMATCDLRWILSTQSRSPLQMQRFEPSIDLDFANGFFEKGCQLNNFFFGTFLPSSRWSRDTVEMQGIELATIFVAPSAFQHFCERDPRTVVGVFGVLIEVVTGHRRNAGIRACGNFGGRC